VPTVSKLETLQSLLYEWTLIDVKKILKDSKITAISFRPVTHSETESDAPARSLLVGVSSGRIALWRIRPNGKSKNVNLVFTIQDERPGAITALAWGNHNYFAVGYPSGDIILYKYADDDPKPNKEHVLKGHTDYIHRLLFCPYQPDTLVSCSKDATVRLWNTQNGTAIKTYCHSGPVFGICTGKKDRMVYILAAGKTGIRCFIKEQHVPFASVDTTSYFTDVGIIGDRIFSCSPLIDTICEWYADKPEPKPVQFKGYQGPDKDGPMPRIEAIMGSYIAVASKAGVHLWDIHNNSPTVHSTLVPADDLVQGGIGGINCGGGLLGVYSRSQGFVAIFGPEMRPNKRRFSPPPTPTPPTPTPPPTVALPQAAPANSLAANGRHNTNVLPSAIASRNLFTVAKLSSGLRMLRFSRRGTEMLTISRDNFLRIWELPARSAVQVFGKAYQLDPPERVHLIITSNDTFALVLIGKKFIIADVCSFKELCCVDVLFSPTALAEHPSDNNVVALGREDGSIQVGSVKELMRTAMNTISTGHNASITSLEFSSGDTLVAANNEGRIFVTMWKAPKISDSLTLPGNSNTPAYLFLNRAKDTAVVYSQKMIGLLNLRNRSWQATQQLPSENSHILTATFASNESRIACLLGDDTLLVLKTETLSVMGRYLLPNQPSCLCGQPNGFIVGTERGYIHRLII